MGFLLPTEAGIPAASFSEREHSPVTSRLDCCNVIQGGGLPLKTVQKLQPVQNASSCLLRDAVGQ